MQNIGQPVLKNLWLSMPPVHEQTAILTHVTKETGPLDTAITRTEREIALMQEYRTRLTADLVTGKLDVREAASKLPEPADQPTVEEAIDENEADLQDEP